MKITKLKVNATAILIIALLYYVMETEIFFAVLSAVIAHELGHVIFLSIFGLRIQRLRVEIKGFCIDYSGYCSAAEHIIIAFAGPLAGFAYAYFASQLSDGLNLEWLSFSSGISLVLSVFNLLPAKPLDGGRIFEYATYILCGEQKGRVICETIGIVIGFAIMAAGILSMLMDKGMALLIASTWIFSYQEGVVKRKEIL